MAEDVIVIDEVQKKFQMIDIQQKKATHRQAIAGGCIIVGAKTFYMLKDRTLPKGDALVLAEIAGIQGAKSAYQHIPLCHPLGLEHVSIITHLDEENFAVEVFCSASTYAKTGVEMEALSGVNAALLAIYDLCKMIEPALVIQNIRLLYKSGGKHGVWQNNDLLPKPIEHLVPKKLSQGLQGKRACIISISDRAYVGTENYPDIGVLLEPILNDLGLTVDEYQLLPDDVEKISTTIQQMVKTHAPDLLFLHGGSGVSIRDKTPEAVLSVCDRVVPGIGELIRQASEKYTPYTWLSRTIGATLDRTLIITIPGSKNALKEVIDIIKDILPWAIYQLHKDL